MEFLVFFVLVLYAAAESERLDHSHKQHFSDGGHNVEFDHEAILGSMNANREFEQLPPAEAQRRLNLILNKMDTDNNGQLSKAEIAAWVVKSFQSLNEEEAEMKMVDIDVNHDKMITWKEYLASTFTYTPEQVKELAEDKNPEIRSFVEVIKDDEAKFKLADLNADGSLDSTEFSSFMHPYNHQHMHKYEIDRMLRIHDANGDGFVDFKEYLGEAKPDAEQLIVDREQFNFYDKDRDGRLKDSEIKVWVLPEDGSIADEEAEHLISESDVNEDGILTREEIIDRYDLWVGSAATNYGQDLHDPSEL